MGCLEFSKFYFFLTSYISIPDILYIFFSIKQKRKIKIMWFALIDGIVFIFAFY